MIKKTLYVNRIMYFYLQSLKTIKCVLFHNLDDSGEPE